MRVRVFISSPSDVAFERRRAQRVLDRLNAEFSGFVAFDAIRWETRFYLAHQDFQPQIVEAKECEIVIGVFWSRLGTALPADFPSIPERLAGRAGETYPSGSAYEVLSAIHQRGVNEAAGVMRPDVFVFRKTAPPLVDLSAEALVAEAKTQWRALEDFFARWFVTARGEIERAFHRFAATDEFEAQVERLLRLWIRENVPEASGLRWSIAEKGSPFRGLAAFDLQHAPIFFGRDLKVRRAVDMLVEADAARLEAPEAIAGAMRRRRPFLLIVGPSGSGKSSLMRAGLAPTLTSPGAAPGVDAWRIAVMRPGDGEDAFDAFARCLFAAADDPGNARGNDALPELSRLGWSEPARLAAACRSASTQVVIDLQAALRLAGRKVRKAEGFDREPEMRLLLMVDQLDDIFATGVEPEQRRRFAAFLLALSESRRIWIVTTLRADFYQALIADRAWIQLKDQGASYDLAPPGSEEIEEILRRSADAAGLRYEIDPQSGEPLDKRLIREARGASILPLLQFALERLFEEAQASDDPRLLRASHYEALGGLDGAIDKAAEAAMTELGPGAAKALPALLRLLVKPVEDGGRGVDGGRYAARSVAKREAANEPAAAALINALIDRRILRASTARAEEGGSIRLAHQRVLESWRRAAKIVESQQDFYRVREDIQQQLERWREGGRRAELLIPAGVPLAEAERVLRHYRRDLAGTEVDYIRQSGRRARLRLTLLRGAALVFLMIAVVAVWQWDSATRARGEAVRNYETARGTVDELIVVFAERLSELKDISAATLEQAYQGISEAVRALGERAGRNDPTFDATRAAMLYEFARLSKRAEVGAAAGGAETAAQRLEESITLRRRLVARYPERRDFAFSLAQSLILRFDFRRAPSPKDAEADIDEAIVILSTLNQAEPAQEHWAETLSGALTRAGDLRRDRKAFQAAFEYYTRQLSLSLETLFLRPDSAAWQDEVAWGLNKRGREKLFAKRGEEALVLFEQELCLRRRAFERDTNNAKRELDVSWSLSRSAGALTALGRPEEAVARLEEAWWIRRRLLGGGSEANLLIDYIRASLDYASAARRTADWATPLALLLDVERRLRVISTEQIPRDLASEALTAPAAAVREEGARRGVSDFERHRREKLARMAAAFDRRFADRRPLSDVCWDNVLAGLDSLRRALRGELRDF